MAATLPNNGGDNLYNQMEKARKKEVRQSLIHLARTEWIPLMKPETERDRSSIEDWLKREDRMVEEMNKWVCKVNHVNNEQKIAIKYVMSNGSTGLYFKNQKGFEQLLRG